MSLKQHQSQEFADTGLNDSGTEDEQKSKKGSGNEKKLKRPHNLKKQQSHPKSYEPKKAPVTRVC